MIENIQKMLFAAVITATTTTPIAPGIIGLNISDITEQTTQEIVVDSRAQQIDAYFAKWDLPLAGQGAAFVAAADKYDLDWRLVASIAMIESTGGKFACGKNPFGWGSCKIRFNSYEEAIETVSKHLAGKHKNTARYYANKNTVQILQAYNPPSIVPDYAQKVMRVMNKIDDMQVDKA